MKPFVFASLLAAVAIIASAQASRSSEHRRPARHGGITQGLECSACHTPAGWRILDGSTLGQGFDHARTGFPLTGQHRQTPCTDCHRGGARQLSRECVSCHQDAHGGRIGQACDRCHSSVGWSRSNAFERHRLTRLPLTGMHALADCTECHQRTTDRGFRNVPADCYACHADDYRRPDVHPLHTGIPRDPSTPPLPRNCAECHRATGWRPALLTAAAFNGTVAAPLNLRAPPEHEAMFPIRTGKHRGAECSSCHVLPSSMRVVRCDGCHAHGPAPMRRAHGAAVNPSPRACLACHPGGAAR